MIRRSLCTVTVILRQRRPSQREGLPTKDLCIFFRSLQQDVAMPLCLRGEEQ